MNRSETAMFLGMAAARDRRTIGEVDVTAWTEDLADISLADAREAMSRHFRESTEWLMPAHIRALVRTIRIERQRGTSAALALPSKFEGGTEQERRNREGRERLQREFLTPLAARREIERLEEERGSLPLSPSDEIRIRALDRARRNKRTDAKADPDNPHFPGWQSGRAS